MKLVVEIDKETYKDIKKGKVYSSFRDVPQESVLAIANGTPIPDNATNGDVIKAMFGDEVVTHNANLIWYGDLFMCNDRVWNAPYQKGSKE